MKFVCSPYSLKDMFVYCLGDPIGQCFCMFKNPH